jgi:DNA-binding transcriptional LysR family regulator
MHLRNLRVFCDVVRRNSFSRAAIDHQMTQSGVSQAVQQLEEYLRVKLIDRSKRPFLLTAEGKAFYSGCVQTLKQFDDLTEEVRSLGTQLDGRVTIAAIYSIGLGYLPLLKKVIGIRLPKAQVRYQFGHPDEVYRMVEQGMVDFGLISYPEPSKSISVTDWREERMLLVAPAGHRLSQTRNVQPSDLADENLVAFASNLRIRMEIDRYLRHLGVSMQVASEFDNIDSVKHALEVNSALAFLPEPAVREELTGGSLVSVDCPWLKLRRPLGLIQRKGASPGPTARGVIELIASDWLDQEAQCAESHSPASGSHPQDGSANADDCKSNRSSHMVEESTVAP